AGAGRWKLAGRDALGPTLGRDICCGAGRAACCGDGRLMAGVGCGAGRAPPPPRPPPPPWGPKACGSDGRINTPPRAARNTRRFIGGPSLLRGLAGELPLRVGRRLAVHVPIRCPPDEVVRVHELVDVRGPAGPAVRQHPTRANNPLLAVLLPEALTEAALGV